MSLRKECEYYMNKYLKLVKIDSDYCDYLRKFDEKVPYNFGKKDSRPFIGVLFIVNNYKYFAPLSSPKPKHLVMRNSIDFMKLDGGKLGVVNFNNMIPVQYNNIKVLNLENYDNEVYKYYNLLKLQLYYLRENDAQLFRHSKQIYDKYLNNKLPQNIFNRCCNFKLLEEKCEEFNRQYIS